MSPHTTACQHRTHSPPCTAASAPRHGTRPNSPTPPALNSRLAKAGTAAPALPPLPYLVGSRPQVTGLLVLPLRHGRRAREGKGKPGPSPGRCPSRPPRRPSRPRGGPGGRSPFLPTHPLPRRRRWEQALPFCRSPLRWAPPRPLLRREPRSPAPAPPPRSLPGGRRGASAVGWLCQGHVPKLGTHTDRGAGAPMHRGSGGALCQPQFCSTSGSSKPWGSRPSLGGHRMGHPQATSPLPGGRCWGSRCHPQHRLWSHRPRGHPAAEPWPGTVWHGVVWHCMAQHNSARHSTPQDGTTRQSVAH